MEKLGNAWVDEGRGSGDHANCHHRRRGDGGTRLGLHLARALSQRATEIFVLEAAEEVGRGLAYATEDPSHLLNVRVANMSAFPDHANHLSEWLRSRRTRRATPMRRHFVLFRGEPTALISLI